MESINDNLHFSTNSAIKTVINGEQILYSDKMEKINDFGILQERNFVITNLALYNFKKTSLKRKIEISKILGITSSLINDEFIVHCIGFEYDYHLVSKKKNKAIEFLALAYFKLKNAFFNFCPIEAKSLSKLVTSKDDKKKNNQISKMPQTLKPITDYIQFSLELMPKDQNPSPEKQRPHSETLYNNRDDIKNVEFADFKSIKVLGMGAFGKVCLVEYIKTKELFAMKIMKKDVLINQDMISNTILEKQILSSIDNIFLLKLNFCFQTKDKVYFVMPFMRGGELFSVLRKFRIFDEDKTRFYSSQIAIALDALHSKGIIYRDLKPENILIDDQGYLKLADFGLAKQLKEDQLASTFCGTPEYISPEVLANYAYSKECDWWSFGILLYEMMCGIPPFYNENHEKMFESIRKNPIKFPKKINLSEEAKDIILRLLDKNQKTRFGSGGINEIKQHPFFQKLNFDDILNKKLTPPFVPELKDKLDVSNFDKEFTELKVEDSVTSDRHMKLIEKNQKYFKDF